MAVAMLATAATAHAQTAENVAVVINEASAESRQIGEYYIKARGIPAANVIRLKTTTEESIQPAAYTATIQAPIAAALLRNNLFDRILYIVLTKGVPLARARHRRPRRHGRERRLRADAALPAADRPHRAHAGEDRQPVLPRARGRSARPSRSRTATTTSIWCRASTPSRSKRRFRSWSRPASHRATAAWCSTSAMRSSTGPARTGWRSRRRT